MLGMQIMPEEVIEAEKVRVMMIPVGGSRLQLLEPILSDSPIARFLRKRGEGLHHIALHVTELPSVVERLRSAGTRFCSDEIRIGAGNHC